MIFSVHLFMNYADDDDDRHDRYLFALQHIIRTPLMFPGASRCALFAAMTQHIRTSDPLQLLGFPALSTTLNNVRCHFLVLMEQARNLKNCAVSIQEQLRPE